MKKTSVQAIQDVHAFTVEAREAIYQAIFSRRDVRGQFLPTPVPDAVLSRILTAAHYAPSVGFMQPWNFLVVQSDEVKRRVHDAFTVAHAEAADMFEGDKRAVLGSRAKAGRYLGVAGRDLHHLRSRAHRPCGDRPHAHENHGSL